MTFTVTYRAKDGALREERIDAASRSECMAECRRRGIAPTGIREGGKSKGRDGARPSRVGAAGDNKRTTAIWVAAAVVLAAIAGGAWWWFSVRSVIAPQAPAKPKVEKPKAEKPKPKPKTVAKPSASAPAVAVAPANVPPPVVTNEYHARFPGENILGVTTNASGYITVSAIGENGRKVRHVVSPPLTFKCPSDEIIMVALATPEGHELPPLPDLGGARADAEFIKSLDTPIEDKPEDSDEIRARKELVRAAREEIKARMDAGEHFADIIRDHCALRNENGAIRSRVQAELNKLVQAGDVEGARTYLETMNGTLSQMGISEIKMPVESGGAAEKLRRVMKAKKEK